MTIKMFLILIVLLQMFMSMMTMALTKTMTMTIRMARAFLRRVSSEVKNRALGEMLCAPVIGKVKAWGDFLAWGSPAVVAWNSVVRAGCCRAPSGPEGI